MVNKIAKILTFFMASAFIMEKRGQVLHYYLIGISLIISIISDIARPNPLSFSFEICNVHSCLPQAPTFVKDPKPGIESPDLSRATLLTLP